MKTNQPDTPDTADDNSNSLETTAVQHQESTADDDNIRPQLEAITAPSNDQEIVTSLLELNELMTTAELVSTAGDEQMQVALEAMAEDGWTPVTSTAPEGDEQQQLDPDTAAAVVPATVTPNRALFAGVGNSWKKPPKRINALHVEGSDNLITFAEHASESTLEKIGEIFTPTVTEGDDEVLYVYPIPKECVATAYVRTRKTVMLCAFNSTKEFMRQNLGKGLDSDDENWYHNHPWTTGSGCPAEHTCTLLNKLVEPYGLGVSRVYVRKGSASYPEHRAWSQSLGINASAMVDGNVTNEEYIASILNDIPDQEMKDMMRASLEAECANYHFQYVTELPQRAMITFAGGYSSNASGGHATYRGPRAKNFSWEIAIEYDLIENCNRAEGVELPDAPDTGDGVLTIQWMDITLPGKPSTKLRDVLWSKPVYQGQNSYSPGKVTDHRAVPGSRPWEDQYGDHYNPHHGRDDGVNGRQYDDEKDQNESGHKKTLPRGGKPFGATTPQPASQSKASKKNKSRVPVTNAYEHGNLAPETIQAINAFCQRVWERDAFELASYEWEPAVSASEIAAVGKEIASLYFRHEIGNILQDPVAHELPKIEWWRLVNEHKFHHQITQFLQPFEKIKERYEKVLTLVDLYSLFVFLVHMEVDQNVILWIVQEID